MVRSVRRSPLRRYRRIAAPLHVLGLLVGVTGCHHSGIGPAPGPTQPAATASAPVDYDPQRAWLTLEQVAPAPAVPDGPTEEAAVAPAIRERLDQARTLEAEGRYAEAVRVL